MKKIIFFFILVLFTQTSVNAQQTVYDDNYKENPNYIQGNKYLENSQYSSAINEFKKAIRVNPYDTSSLIGLSNAYNMRAVYYNNTVKAPLKAISDIKSALFFVKYFPDSSGFASQQSITSMEKNLSTIENSLQSAITPEKRFSNAKALRVSGEFAAAGYDYYQLINNNKYSSQSYLALGDIYTILNNPKKALNMYQNALKTDSNNTEIHLKLARTYEQLNDYTSSLKEYNYALETSAEREDILSSLERIWQKKVDESPQDAEAHSNLGVVYQKEKRYSEAMSEYKKAEQYNPSNLNTKINIGTLYQEQKNYNEAINTYNSILQLQPQNVNVLTYKAECMKALNRNEDAVSLYKAVLSIDPKNAAVKAELFELLKNTMPTEDLLSYLYKNVQNSPMDANAYYEFAYELHKANKIDDAITYYRQTINMDSKNTDAYINLSQAYRQKKDYNSAYEIIKKAREIAPDNLQVKNQYNLISQEMAQNSYNTASDAFQSGDYKKAISEYMKINPPTQDSLIAIAAAYQSLSDNNNAIIYYKKAMELAPKNPDIPYYIASLYANSDDLANAKKYNDIALSNNPNNKQAKELKDYISAKNSEENFNNAVNLYNSQKYSQAETELTKIISTTPNDTNVYYYRALCYDALKNYQKAINDYKSALKYTPDFNMANYSIAVDYDSLENYDLAKIYYKKFIENATENDEYLKYSKSRLEELN